MNTDGQPTMEDDDLLIDDGEDMADDEGEEEDLLADVASTAAQAWNWGEPEPVPSTPARPTASAAATVPQMAPPPKAAAPAQRPATAPAARPTTGLTPAPAARPAPVTPRNTASEPLRTPPAATSGPTFSQELNAFLKPSKPGASEVDDLDLAEMLDIPSQLTPAAPAPAPAVAADAGRGVRVLVVDPESVRVESVVEKSLERMGFAPTLVETGTAARDELGRGEHPVAFLRITGDAGWARMLLMTSQERCPDVKFVVMVPKGSAGLTQQLIECGAADVMEEPLPPDANLLFHIQALIPQLLPNAAHSQHMLDDMEQLRSRLTAAVAQSEARAREMAQRAAEAEQRLQAVSNENTRAKRELSTVRGEAGNLRERAETLQESLRRTEMEVQSLRTKNVELESAARAAPAPAAAGGAGESPDAALLGEVKKLVAALHPYGFAMDQALTFLADMGKQPGVDPGLARHTKNLLLCRAVIKRLESKVGGPTS